ncbi:hypothetical protein ABD76_10495 [Paenibacillus dendritiformis]|uniref:SDR family NAD(P)-dependent oxidoreductase n=1 Tax=Paenibacillus dendritiformis TaxID=130049 RepID=UPI0018CD6EE4|nr:SDR family NAD(P)-dependent oxidoreductase [Paenibacillus dendritiformis]MBG9792895.1 hypothetical protein [Paenibacillus dendritiformis]
MLPIHKLDTLSSDQRTMLLNAISERGREYNIFPLSSEQKRMWFLYRTDTDNPWYNAGIELVFQGRPDVSLAERTLNLLLERHEILRTLYFSLEGIPFQAVQQDRAFPLPVRTIGADATEQERTETIGKWRQEQRMTPFRLDQDIPMRALWVHTAAEEAILMLTFHHIAMDGWSFGLLFEEFVAIYRALMNRVQPELPHVTAQYADYACWQEEMIKRDSFQRQLEYWKRTLQLDPERTELNLPQDEAAAEGRARANMVKLQVDGAALQRLKHVARESRTSTFAALLSVYCILIHRYTDQRHIRVGTPIVNRQQEKFERTFGFFANTLVLSASVDGHDTFRSVLETVTRNMMEAFAHQDVPFDHVVEAAGAHRHLSANPLFEVMFTMHHEGLLKHAMGRIHELPEATVQLRPLSHDQVEDVQFHIVFTAVETPDALEIVCTYQADLYAKERIEALLHCFHLLLQQAMTCPDEPLRQFKLVNREEEARYEAAWGHGVLPYRPSQLRELWMPLPLRNMTLRRRCADGCLVSIADGNGIVCPPYFEGNVYVCSNGQEPVQWYKTGDRGYWNASGELQLTSTAFPSVSIGTSSASTAVIARELLQHTSATDCYISIVRAESPYLLIFYVAEQDIPRHTILSYIPSELSFTAIRLHHIPRTSDGSIDGRQLARDYVQDAADALQLKQQVLLHADVDQAELLPEVIRPMQGKYALDSLRTQETDARNDASAGEQPHAEVPEHPLHPEQTAAKTKAIASGGRLGASSYRHIGQLLQAAARQHPRHGVGIVNNEDTFVSYAEIEDYAARIHSRLAEEGLVPGNFVIFQIKRLDLFIYAFWGCMMGGYIPVPLDVPAQAGDEEAAAVKLSRVSELLDFPIVIADAAGTAVVQDVLGPSASIRAAEQLILHPHDGIHYYQPRETDVALLMCTSGSTGIPKGVQLSHRNIIKQSQAAAQVNGLTSDDISVNWMPLVHVGGIVMFHIRDVYCGMKQYHAYTDYILQQPLRWIDLLDATRATVTWAPNFAYGLVLEHREQAGKQRRDLSRMRVMMNGGEGINARTCAAFIELFQDQGLSPQAMRPTWGMTETSSAVTYSRRFQEIVRHGMTSPVEAGEPVPGIELRITDDQGRVVAEGAIGHLEVRGETVTAGYYRNPEQNRISFDAEGWFRTGDLAVIAGGRLSIAGRSKDVIIINGMNYNCVDIEQAVEATGGAAAGCTAMCAYTDSDDSGRQNERIALFYVPNESADNQDGLLLIKTALHRQCGQQADVYIALTREEIPRTAIGKIQKNVLLERWKRGDYAEQGDSAGQMLPAWFYAPEWRQADVHLTLAAHQPENCLLLMHAAGLGPALAGMLEQAGHQCYAVTLAAANKKDGRRYTVDAWSRENVDWVMADLAAQSIHLHRLIHVLGYDAGIGAASDRRASTETCLESAASLLHFVQSYLNHMERPASARCIVVTRSAFKVEPEDSAAWSSGAAAGLLQSLGLEESQFTVTQLDLDGPDSMSMLEQGAVVIREMEAPSPEPQVAYRNGNRYLPVLIPFDMKETIASSPAALKRGAAYVITGGLGGIGRLVCRHLLAAYGAEVIVIGRTDLSEATAKAVERRQALQRLQRLGRIRYILLDIGQPGELQNILAQIHREGSISGIFHLAAEGSLLDYWQNASNRLVQSETLDYFRTMFAARVQGAEQIFSFARQHPGIKVILFNSVNGLFGGSAFAAYSAANSCARALADSYAGTVDVISLYWSMWDDIGMSSSNLSGAKEASNQMGYMPILPREGMQSLELALRLNAPHVVIGIDGCNANLNVRHRSIQANPLIKWHVLYSARSGREIPPDELLSMQRKGASLLFMESWPADWKNAQNITDILPQATISRSPQDSLPKNETERELCAIWTELLGHQNFDVERKFFEAGGNSIRSLQLLSRINETFGLEVSIADIFQYSSIREMSAYIRSLKQGEMPDDEDSIIGMTF